MLRQAQHDKAQRARAIAISMKKQMKTAWPFEKVETGFPKRGIALAYTTYQGFKNDI
jgi:hypothetical protein